MAFSLGFHSRHGCSLHACPYWGVVICQTMPVAICPVQNSYNILIETLQQYTPAFWELCGCKAGILERKGMRGCLSWLQLGRCYLLSDQGKIFTSWRVSLTGEQNLHRRPLVWLGNNWMSGQFFGKWTWRMYSIPPWRAGKVATLSFNQSNVG